MANGYSSWSVAWLWIRVAICNLAELPDFAVVCLTKEIYDASMCVVVSRSNRYISAK